MLNRQQLRNYRQLRELSTRDVAFYCELSQPMIVQIENGTKPLTEYNYIQFINGINSAYSAKRLGYFEKAPRVKQPKKGRKKKVEEKQEC